MDFVNCVRAQTIEFNDDKAVKELHRRIALVLLQKGQSIQRAYMYMREMQDLNN